MSHEFCFPLYDLIIFPPSQQLNKYPIVGEHILQTDTYPHGESVHINNNTSFVNLKYLPAKNNHDFTHFYHVSAPLYKWVNMIENGIII